jgi:uncharacterized protein YkwD
MRLLLLFLLIPLPLWAEGEPQANAPSVQVIRTALEWMQSTDPARRQAAYRSAHLLGKEALPAFSSALRKARKFHADRLTRLLNDRTTKGNPYLKLEPLAEELAPERERVYALIKTDYHKDPSKIRMLRNEFEGVEKLYEQATRITRTDPSAFDAKVDAMAAVLVELDLEIARFENDSRNDPDTPADELRKQALSDSFDGDRYLQDKTHFATLKAERDALAAADAANAQCSWANSSQKDFAAHLNHERAVMGLGPLRLDELLSKAATGHSNDMRTLGFFDHSSPVKGKRSPSDRARKAGFQGRWTGENIYMGSSVYTAAYSGWFGSDGHRFIMFASGPNLIGLGPVGKHWTLMTGQRRLSP